MVALSILVDVFIIHLFPGDFGDETECFEDRNGVLPAATKVIRFSHARGPNEFVHKAGNVQRMDIIPHLFAFVTEDLVGLTFQVAFDQIAEEAM